MNNWTWSKEHLLGTEFASCVFPWVKEGICCFTIHSLKQNVDLYVMLGKFASLQNIVRSR